MAERVFYVGDKVPFINPDEYLSLSDEVDRIICLSLRDIHVINGYLWPYTEWRTRFSRPYTNNRRQESTVAEFSEYQLNLSDLSERLGEASVSSCADGLLAIAEALSSLGGGGGVSVTCGCGCAGSGGAGQSAPPYSEFEQGEIGVGDPPEGFGTWEQYTTNKCAVATDILTKMKGNVGRLGTLNLVGATVTSLIPVITAMLLDPIPGDEIAVIAAVLLVVLGAGYTILDFISDVLSDHESEFICALYGATTSEQAKADFITLFGELWVSDGGSSVTAISATSLVSSLLPSSVTNRLFTLETSVTLPEGDCSGCEEADVPILEWVYGSGDLSFDTGARVLTSGENNGSHYVRLDVSGDPCLDWHIHFESVTGSPFTEVALFNCAGAGVVSGNVYPSAGTNWTIRDGGVAYPGVFSLGSLSPFTVTVRIESV